MSEAAVPPLPSPARYQPFLNGRYDVAPGLKPLGTSFGNGAADDHAFQIDAQFAAYRANKDRCRAERLEKYCALRHYEPAVAAAVMRFFLKRLPREHPALFHVQDRPQGPRLHCRLTGETLAFAADLRLIGTGGGRRDALPYRDAFDALCSQVQEDVAVVSTVPECGDWLSAVHVCAPSHWAPAAKLGQDFAQVHAPVPGIGRVNQVAGAMVDAMIRRGPFIRFVWGIDTDPRLNRHPEPPPGVSACDWTSPPFDPSSTSPFVVRVERQVTWGIPEVGAALFLIRLYQIPAADLRRDPEARTSLRAALASMSPESRAYKGLESYAEALIAWLDDPPCG